MPGADMKGNMKTIEGGSGMSAIAITEPIVEHLIRVVDAGLIFGVGEPEPGKMCVEAAVCFALGLDHGDEPTCVSRAVRKLKIRLNDCSWSSPAARAKGLRKLAVLQLGTNEGFDNVRFAREVAMMAVTKLLPKVLRLKKMEEQALVCEAATDLIQAKDAADDAGAAYAADAADDADAAYAAAAYAAAYVADAVAADAADAAAAYAADAADAVAADAAYAAAAYAADAADAAAAYVADAADAYAAAAAARDKMLSEFAEDVSQILIGMGVPGVKWLPLLEVEHRPNQTR